MGYPSKEPNRVKEYFKEYYANKKIAIAEKRLHRRRVDDVYCEQQRQAARDYYTRESRRLCDFPISDEFIASLDAGVLPQNIAVDLQQHFGCAVQDVQKVEDGWANATLEIVQRDNLLCIYRKISAKKRRANGPRWVLVDGTYVFLYPLTMLEKQQRNISKWVQAGYIPSVCDDTGRYWLPSFVMRKLAGFAKVTLQDVRELFPGGTIYVL